MPPTVPGTPSTATLLSGLRLAHTPAAALRLPRCRSRGQDAQVSVLWEGHGPVLLMRGGVEPLHQAELPAIPAGAGWAGHCPHARPGDGQGPATAWR